MKKLISILLLLSLILSFGACGKSDDETHRVTEDPVVSAPETQSNLQANDLPQIETRTISEDNYWEEIDTAINRDCVTNVETAVSISDCILSQYQAEGYYVDYVPQLVEFQADPGIWVVSYWKNETIPQASFSIVIRKDNAEVLRMWIGE